jgi:hypothetical protein
MTDFLIDCYFNGLCKGRKNFVPTPRYAKKLRAMRHSAELKKGYISVLDMVGRPVKKGSMLILRKNRPVQQI